MTRGTSRALITLLQDMSAKASSGMASAASLLDLKEKVMWIVRCGVLCVTPVLQVAELKEKLGQESQKEHKEAAQLKEEHKKLEALESSSGGSSSKASSKSASSESKSSGSSESKSSGSSEEKSSSQSKK